MMNHVSARCAHYRLLFPSRNIESIVTLGEGVRLLPPLKRGPQPGADYWPTLASPQPLLVPSQPPPGPG